MADSIPQSDEALTDLVAQQVNAGNIEAAKVTASQINSYEYRRQAWLTILYNQFNELNDLRGVKETILSLPDSNLWLGSWVHDLILFTARSGDIDGAKSLVQRLPEESPRGHFLMLIVNAQAQSGDYHGAESTLATLPHDSPWHDFSLVMIAKEMKKRGDIAQIEAIIARITDTEIKSSAAKLFIAPTIQG
jgi:hypothetical protein